MATRTISTVKPYWLRLSTNKRTTAAYAKEHPEDVVEQFEHVEVEEQVDD